MADDYGDFIPKKQQPDAPGTGVPNLPVVAAPVAPQQTQAAPAAPTPNANDIILQHLGQGGIGSDRVVAPPRQESWWDAVPGTKYYGEPAQPGQQSWLDWFSKNYRPSAADIGTAFGDDWSYGLTPWMVQGAQGGAKGIQSATGGVYDPFPTGLTPEAMRARIQEAHENVGPGEIPISIAAMATSPLTYLGIGPETKVAGKLTEAFAPDAADLAAKYLPEKVAGYVPEQLFPNMVKGGTAAGTTAAAHTAGAGGSPTDIAKSFGENALVGAGIAGVANTLPMGRATPEDVVGKTIQASQDADTQAANVKIPSKQLGFQVGGGQREDPSAQTFWATKNGWRAQACRTSSRRPRPPAPAPITPGRCICTTRALKGIDNG